MTELPHNLNKNTPTVQPLSHRKRHFVFLTLVTIFVCVVPIFAFYATGYRYDFFSNHGGITATGGLYISILADNGELFLDELPVRDVRIFRKASYVQNIVPGVHHIHVQEPGLTTWAKNLPVYPYLVTEAEAFLMPARPQVRLITPYQTATGTPVFLGLSTSTVILPLASTTQTYLIRKTHATGTLMANSEYDFVEGLFAESTLATSTPLKRAVPEVRNAFTFAPLPLPATTTTATTTRTYHNIQLFERDGDIFARYTGPQSDTPYYFCVPKTTLASTTELYGAQVSSGIMATLAAPSAVGTTETTNTSRICRDEIRIDAQHQKVWYFDFLPGSSDVVLEYREDGIFVVEIDDRAWQNTQQLYPASAQNMIINNGRIYVLDHGVYFELLTTLIKP